MLSVLPAARAEFLQRQPIRIVALVLFRVIVALLTLGARQCNEHAISFFCHFCLHPGCGLKTRRGSPWWGSNSRPHPYQGCALPLSYMGQRVRFYQTRPASPIQVVGAGFEPAYDFRRTVLQTVAINHSATPPGTSLCILGHTARKRQTAISSEIDCFSRLLEHELLARVAQWRGHLSHDRR